MDHWANTSFPFSDFAEVSDPIRAIAETEKCLSEDFTSMFDGGLLASSTQIKVTDFSRVRFH